MQRNSPRVLAITWGLVLNSESAAKTTPVLVPETPQRSWKLIAVGIALVVAAAATYLLMRPAAKDTVVSPVVAPSWKLPSMMAPVSSPVPAPHTTNVGDIDTMAEKLAARLQTQPDDAQGWAILARSYDVMGKMPDALMAYKRASALLPGDQVLLADYAKAVAKANQGGGAMSTSPKPVKP